MSENRSLKGIVIDPGHGGKDGGATGNGLIEKNVALDISKYMYDRFKELGIPVALSRNSDIDLNPTNRPKVILDKFGNSSDVIVISNHLNSGNGEGAEVIYSLRNKDTLAKKILSNLEAAGQKSRKYYQRRLPSNSSKDYYYIHRDTPNAETVLIEYGFIDNINDADKIKKNYKTYADAVIKSVLEYKGIPYKASSSNAVSDNVYIVKSGDTLWNIAKKNNLTVDELKKINNLQNNTLKIGQKLVLSNKSNTDNYYIVQPGDTLYSIANKNKISVDSLKKANNLNTNTIKVGQKLIIPGNNITYTVKSGDTLYSIANKYGTTVDKIKKQNNLSSNTLSIGQKLSI